MIHYPCRVGLITYLKINSFFIYCFLLYLPLSFTSSPSWAWNSSKEEKINNKSVSNKNGKQENLKPSSIELYTNKKSLDPDQLNIIPIFTYFDNTVELTAIRLSLVQAKEQAQLHIKEFSFDGSVFENLIVNEKMQQQANLTQWTIEASLPPNHPSIITDGGLLLELVSLVEVGTIGRFYNIDPITISIEFIGTDGQILASTTQVFSFELN